MLWKVIRVVALIILGMVACLVLKHARPSSNWLYIPFCFGPVAGIYWVIHWMEEIRKSVREPREPTVRTTAFYVVFFMIFSYVFLVLTFAAGYTAAGKISSAAVDTTDGCREVVKFREYLYLSAVTGSTLGYGDLVPRGKGRILASIEVLEFWMLLGVMLLHAHRIITVRKTEGFPEWCPLAQVMPRL